MRIATTNDPGAVARAIALDAAVPGSFARGTYIGALADIGGLSTATSSGEIQAFRCLDHHCFFGKPFISLLVVAPEAGRRGLGAVLLSHATTAHDEIWTSTNRSNRPVRSLFDSTGWHFCGEIDGLDPGDPERVYKKNA